MKKLSFAFFLFCGLTSGNALHAQPIAQNYNQGYDAVAENDYAYIFGTYASNQSAVSSALTNLFYGYESWVNNGDSNSAAIYCYYAYQDFFSSGLVDQVAFDNAYNNGTYLFGNIGYSDTDAWDACWLSLEAAYDYYYGYIF